MSTTFADLLSPQRLTEIVDVGANPIDGEPPYVTMLSAGLCRVTGFEPQEQALLELQRKKGPNERYLPYAVGDGGRHTLNVCVASGMTSLFEPDPNTLVLFNDLKPLGEVIRRIPVETRKLDDISEIHYLDFLKIDIQGGELAVFKGGATKLSKAVAVQTEISFVPLYKNQPCLGDVDLEMRRQGFIPHLFAAVKQWPLAPCVVDGNPRQPLHQLLEADIVYVRDFSRPESMSDEQLKHLALIVHHCYGSFDLALRCVMLLEQRQALESGARNRYLQLVRKAGPASISLQGTG
jgi:FkbM family methyltransferase